MGHSLHRIRGREVYGDETNLRIRALNAEMIAFPTTSWLPRPYSKVAANGRSSSMLSTRISLISSFVLGSKPSKI